MHFTNIPEYPWRFLNIPRDFQGILTIFKGCNFWKSYKQISEYPKDFDDFWISLGLLFWRFWRFSRAAVFKHLRKKFIEKPSLQHIQYLYFLNIVDFVIGYACMVGSPLFKMIKLYNYVEFNVVDRTVWICFVTNRTVIL